MDQHPQKGLDLEKYDLYPLEEADLGDQMDNEDSSDDEEEKVNSSTNDIASL